jgi:hypothetical protein
MPIVKAASRELHLLWRIPIIWKSRKQSIIVCLRSRAVGTGSRPAHLRRALSAVGAKRSNDPYLYRSSDFWGVYRGRCLLVEGEQSVEQIQIRFIVSHFVRCGAGGGCGAAGERCAIVVAVAVASVPSVVSDPLVGEQYLVGNEIGLTARFVRHVCDPVAKALSVTSLQGLIFADFQSVRPANERCWILCFSEPQLRAWGGGLMTGPGRNSPYSEAACYPAFGAHPQISAFSSVNDFTSYADTALLNGQLERPSTRNSCGGRTSFVGSTRAPRVQLTDVWVGTFLWLQQSTMKTTSSKYMRIFVYSSPISSKMHCSLSKDFAAGSNDCRLCTLRHVHRC